MSREGIYNSEKYGTIKLTYNEVYYLYATEDFLAIREASKGDSSLPPIAHYGNIEVRGNWTPMASRVLAEKIDNIISTARLDDISLW